MLLLHGPEYRRKDWPRWIDADGDCQNTRAEILQRDSVGAVQFHGKRQCSVATGSWICPYTGRVLMWAHEVDIDHVVPLAWAHKHGGALWSREMREAFVNDPDNLLAVDEGINKEKGSKGPKDWLPPKKVFRQEYLEIWWHILEKYNLPVY